jgi:hypothetical protein
MATSSSASTTTSSPPRPPPVCPSSVLKQDEAFLVANRRGDLAALPDSESGFYVDGTRFLRRLELRVHGQRPIVLNAGVSEDALQAGIDLTNPDVALAPEVVLPVSPTGAYGDARSRAGVPASVAPELRPVQRSAATCMVMRATVSRYFSSSRLLTMTSDRPSQISPVIPRTELRSQPLDSTAPGCGRGAHVLRPDDMSTTSRS